MVTPEPTTSEETSEITIPESEPTVVSDESTSKVVTEAAAPIDEHLNQQKKKRINNKILISIFSIRLA